MADDQMQRWIDQMTVLSAEFNRYLEPLTSNLARIAKEMEPLAQTLVLSSRIARVTEVSGWLPYRTVPYGRFHQECGGEVNALSVRVSCYYKCHSQIILQDINSQLMRYAVDEEAKATLREALKAHEHSLYRCVCRVLMPEIERVVREDWLGIEKIGSLSQQCIEKKVDRHYLEDFIMDGPADFVLFGHFIEDLFVWVKNRRQVQRQSTVNRHAASHGWTAYSSMQYSLNTIICADYIFRMVTYFKNRRVEMS